MTLDCFLPANPPFSLVAVAESHGWVQLPPFRWADAPRVETAWDREAADGGTLTRVERLTSGQVVELCMRERGVGVQVEVSEQLTEAEAREIEAKVGWMLQLDQDFSAFYARTEDEPRLAHVERLAKGRILRSPTLFEDVVKTILTTNVQWSGTIRMTGALVERFGACLTDDAERRAFPTAASLAAADETALREAGLGYRAPYVLALARAVVSGEMDLEELKSAEVPTDELHHRLLSIKGVGEYAAASLMMLLGRYAFIPVDSWARQMVSREWHDGVPVAREEVEAAFEGWGPWRGLAYWFWDWRHR